MPDMEITDGGSAGSGTAIDIYKLDLDHLPVLKAEKLSKTTRKEISERIVAELFRDLRVDVVSNLRCFEACVKRINQNSFFSETRLAKWRGYRSILKMAMLALEAAERHGRVIVLPGPQLIAYWAAMDIRKLKGDVRDDATRILRILDAHRHVATAISIFSQHQDMFFVDVKAVVAPTMTGERLGGYPIVQAVSGSPNRWTAYMTFGNGHIDNAISVNNSRSEPTQEKPNGIKEIDQESARPKFGNRRDPETHDESEDRIVKVTVDLTREEVMASAGDLFSKLAQPWRFSEQDLTGQVDAWISNDRVALLDETNRGHLLMWCSMNSHPWADKIKALPKSYYSVLRREKERLEPEIRQQSNKNISKHISSPSKRSKFSMTQEHRTSHTKAPARAEVKRNPRHRKPFKTQPRTPHRPEAYTSPASYAARSSGDALNEVSSVADKMRGAVEQLGAILEEESRKRPRTAAQGEYSGNESKEMPSLHFNALISLFHALGNENGDEIRAALTEFCDATNMSSRQRERAFGFL